MSDLIAAHVELNEPIETTYFFGQRDELVIVDGEHFERGQIAHARRQIRQIVRVQVEYFQTAQLIRAYFGYDTYLIGIQR